MDALACGKFRELLKNYTLKVLKIKQPTILFFRKINLKKYALADISVEVKIEKHIWN